MVPCPDLVCTNFLEFGPTMDWFLHSRCSIHKSQPRFLLFHLGHKVICILALTAPSTSSSFRDSIIGTAAYKKICRPKFRQRKFQIRPSSKNIKSPAQHHSAVQPQKVLQDHHDFVSSLHSMYKICNSLKFRLNYIKMYLFY